MQHDFYGWEEIASALSSLMGRSVSVEEARDYDRLYGLPVLRLIPRRPQLSREAAEKWVAERRKLAEEERERKLAEQARERSLAEGA